MVRDALTALDMTVANNIDSRNRPRGRIAWLRDGTAAYQMASAVVGGIVFRLSIFFVGEVREPGDRAEESRRHVHA